MAIVEILDVSLSEKSERLWGREINTPTAGSRTDVYALSIQGWVLGQASPAIAIEVVYEGETIRTAPVRKPRPDVAARYQQVSGAETCGFWMTIGVHGMAPEFKLLIRAMLQDGSSVPLAVIRGVHQPLRTGFEPKLQPLLITTLGRSGSTWLMRLLTEHSRIVVQRLHPYETRAAGYWMNLLKLFSDPPAHPSESANPPNFPANVDSLWHHLFHPLPVTVYPQLRVMNPPQLLHWFERTYPENLAAFYQNSIETFYQHVALNQGQNEPIYFAEKNNGEYIAWLMWELYPRAREIILIRDFRDMVTSILAFNAKKGREGFGRGRANSDEEYIRKVGVQLRVLLQSWESRAAQAHFLRYEDLILRPVETLEALLTYLGLDATPSIIEGMLQRASEETRKMQLHRTTPDAKASIGRWQHDLNPSLQSACQEAFGDLLSELGYTREGGLVPLSEAAFAQPRAVGAGTEMGGDGGHATSASSSTSYLRLADHIQTSVRDALLPPEARVLVISKGDDELLKLDGRRAAHFPQSIGGAYAGHHPASSAEAITHLKTLRERGAEYLLIPRVSFWWLEHYAEFGEHLHTQHQRIWADEHCVIYQLFELAQQKSAAQDLT